jgi:hypothetical protein
MILMTISLEISIKKLVKLTAQILRGRLKILCLAFSVFKIAPQRTMTIKIFYFNTNLPFDIIGITTISSSLRIITEPPIVVIFALLNWRMK